MATPTLLLLISLVFFFFFSLSVAFAAERCHPNDKKALLKIKKDLNNPLALTSWNPNTDCCLWSFINCGDTNTNRTTGFDITDTNLNLPIPAAIGDLPYLQTLSFQNCNVTGPIPRFISKLSELAVLDLRQNQLTGSIPAILGHLKKLAVIYLSFNSLTGSIPASLSQLPLLGSLLLEQNKLTGSIPESFADFNNPTLTLGLSNNQLSGPIPRRLGNANFSSIAISSNKLGGDISFLFGKNKSMIVGDFSRNRFEFDLSKVEFSEALLNLDLSNNKIYGSLPKDLSSSGLIALNVSYNRLCGPIPDDPRFQTFDVSSFLHNKCLCGKPLPPCK